MYATVKTTADFTDKENAAIEELKRRTRDHMKKEMYENKVFFYRVLKARDFVIDDAEKMLKNLLDYRKRMNYDEILDYKPPEPLDMAFGNTRIGYDKEGSVIHYLAFGKLEVRKALMCCSMVDIEKAVLKIMAEEELYQDEFEKKNMIAPGFLHIVDAEGLTFRTITDYKVMETYRKLFKVYQDVFPEREKVTYVVRTNPLFSLGFNLVKHALASALQKKIKVCNQHSWKEDILKVIDKDVLPAFLGGTRTDPDGNPLCLSFVNQGGQHLEPFYRHRSVRSLKDYTDVQTITIPKESFKEIFLPVSNKGLFIKWEFETKRHDIGFRIYLKSNGEEEEVLPLQRYSTDDFSEEGEHMCIKPGTYVAVFDNTYSWLREKQVYYKLIVTDS